MASANPNRNPGPSNPPINMKVEQTGTATAWMEHPQYPGLYRPPQNIYEQVRSIADLPLIRPLGLRIGKEINFLHNSSHGLSNYKTILAHQRGQLQSDSCSCCVGPNPMGPFQLCVVIKSLNAGACTNCAYNGNGIRCTLRIKNSDGTPVNPNTVIRQAAVRREQTIDRTPEVIINVENGAVENPRSTPKIDTLTSAIPSPATSSGFVRRQAARAAESRLSHYTYRESDVGGSGIKLSDVDDYTTGNESSEGWPDIARVSAEKLQAEALRQPSRGSFMAKRGGGKKSHTRTKSGDVESTKRSRTTTLEDSDHSSDGEPLARRRKIRTSPTPEEEETPALVTDPKSVANNLALDNIPLPEKPNTAMKSLLSMFPHRTLGWRENASRDLNSRYCVEAAIGYCVGDVVNPCSRCAEERGSFAKCVTVYGHFQQSCASCHYTGRGTYCTFYVAGSTDRGIVRVPAAVDREISMADKAPSESLSRKSLPRKSLSAVPPPASATPNTGTSVAKVVAPPATSKSIEEGATKAGAPPKDSGSIAAKTGPPMAKGPTPCATVKPTVTKIHRTHSLASEEATPSSTSKSNPAANVPTKTPSAKQPVPLTTKNVEKTSPEPVVRSPRYLKALREAEQMSLEEQLLEVAEIKFQISVIGNVIAQIIPPSSTPRYNQAQDRFKSMSSEEQQLELASYKFQLSVMQDAVGNRRHN